MGSTSYKHTSRYIFFTKLEITMVSKSKIHLIILIFTLTLPIHLGATTVPRINWNAGYASEYGLNNISIGIVEDPSGYWR